ncbi:MAG: dihydroorotase [Firmicutes bacterium]|nr:dihydroorotase [Bacillota bacterium]
MSILIKGGNLLLSNSDGHSWARGDVRVAGSQIVAIGPNIEPQAGDMTIDAVGKMVAAGLVDTHAHLREPGREDQETIATGTKAAAAGGFTTIACMPNTTPPLDSGAVAAAVLQLAKEAAIRVVPVGCVTKGRQGKELAEIGELVEAGVWGITDDGNPVEDSELMRRALEYCRPFRIPVISHAEDPRLMGQGVMHEGFISTILGLPGIPAEAESVMVARDILLAKATNSWLHVAHVSTSESVELITRAKAKGVRVTCEATPHHLVLTDEAVRGFDTNTKVNPPLRSREHVQALRVALADGTIDCIATDHAPHTLEEKDCDYRQAAFGLIGLETALPLLITHLVKPGFLDLPTLWDRMSARPARLMGLTDHGLAIGKRADITIVDLELEKEVEPAKGFSRSQNTPFAGQRLIGWPVITIAGGRVAFGEVE